MVVGIREKKVKIGESKYIHCMAFNAALYHIRLGKSFLPMLIFFYHLRRIKEVLYIVIAFTNFTYLPAFKRVPILSIVQALSKDCIGNFMLVPILLVKYRES